MGEEWIKVKARSKPRVPPLALLVAALLATGVAVLVLAASTVTLGVSEVAVVVDPLFGTVSRPILGPAVFLKAPWAYVVKDSTAVETIEFAQAEAAVKQWVHVPPTVLTRDGVSVTVEVVVRYQVEPSTFDQLVRDFPNVDYDDRLMVPLMRQIIRDEISKVSLDELITNRDVISRRIQTAYLEAVSREGKLAGRVKVLEVNILNFILPPEIASAINQKIAAQQQAIRAMYERQRIEELARANYTKRVLEAEAQANATLTVAQAEAKSLLLKANATRAALHYVVSQYNDTELARIYLYMLGLQEVARAGATVIVTVPGAQATPIIVQPGQKKP
ncbi:prohibitin family protein [Infirmifilum lucidum]|uniref:Prohibitin family protein n=1 Tax=Infirmifilum lucidum TaxID=2776706 RepID=A0A7L9FGE8_9CREN|nr:SPFH domain-containing protein [Infirmifilum lucidum]QOJ78829.1 prohibitin family protein [Infirmifilum lucidum]